MNYTFNFTPVWQNWPLLLEGLALGLGLATLSIAIGSFAGLVLAFCATGKHMALRALAFGYVSIVRNLPILVIVLFIFFGLPQLGLAFDKSTSFILALSLYAAAYMTEVFRAGLLGVPPGISEAGQAIGLTPLSIKYYVVLPVMLRNAMPAFANNFVSLFKDTSLAAAIAVPELTFYAQKVNSESFRVLEVWSVTAALYIATCYLISLLLRGLESRLRL